MYTNLKLLTEIYNLRFYVYTLENIFKINSKWALFTFRITIIVIIMQLFCKTCVAIAQINLLTKIIIR